MNPIGQTPDPLAKVVARRVRQRMEELRWLKPDGEPNAKELERRSGIGYGTAHKMVNLGDSDATFDLSSVEKVAKALRVSPHWLLGEVAFDDRAFEQGKAVVREAVGAALNDAMGAPPPTPQPEGETEPPDADTATEVADERPRGSEGRRSAGDG